MFKLIKSGFDGISGGQSQFETIADVLKEISYSKGWDSLAQLHKSIKAWAKKCRPGDVYCTQASAVICNRIDYGMGEVCPKCGADSMNFDCGELDPQEGEENTEFVQRVECTCGHKWLDVFTHTARRILA